MSCNSGFGHATESFFLGSCQPKMLENISCLYVNHVNPMLLFWVRVSAGWPLRLKLFHHTALCSADNNEFVILGFVLPKFTWIGGRSLEFRGGRISETFKHRGIWWKNPSAKMRSQFWGGPISGVVARARFHCSCTRRIDRAVHGSAYLLLIHGVEN